VSRQALEHNEDQHDQYQMYIAENFHPTQLVFIDESGFDGYCTEHILIFVRHSILPALLLDGILHLGVQEHSYTLTTFNEFIDNLLENMNPYPQKNLLG
ncbi:hypothetical protein EDC04DRAFT_2559688, partial [Pisolithus marmoratus]